MNVTIRPARPADGPAIAALHFRMWRKTYRDLAPEDAYRTLTEPVRVSRWQAMLAGDVFGHTILVAESEERLAGFGAAGPPSHDAFQGRAEVKFLYVDRAFKRRGIGRILLGALASDMLSFGHRAMALGVVAGNDPAIAFYESVGGRRVGAYTDPGPVWRSDNLVYAWDDLEELVARSGAVESVPKEA